VNKDVQHDRQYPRAKQMLGNAGALRNPVGSSAAAASKLFDDLIRSGASDLKGSVGGLALMAGSSRR
jgi:hypothetical protein